MEVSLQIFDMLCIGQSLYMVIPIRVLPLGDPRRPGQEQWDFSKNKTLKKSNSYCEAQPHSEISVRRTNEDLAARIPVVFPSDVHDQHSAVEGSELLLTRGSDSLPPRVARAPCGTRVAASGGHPTAWTGAGVAIPSSPQNARRANVSKNIRFESW